MLTAFQDPVAIRESNLKSVREQSISAFVDKMMNVEKVNVLSSIIVVCKVMGLYSYKNSNHFNFLNKILNIILTILVLVLLFPVLAYFLKNLSDVGAAAEALSVLFALILNCGQYILFALKKNDLRQLFIQFQETVDKSNHFSTFSQFELKI